MRAEIREHLDVLVDYAYNNDKMTRALCTKSGVDVGALKLRTPSFPLLDALADDAGIGTPATPSIISAVSSTSSLHIDRMTMESPISQSMGLPIAGPSRLGLDTPEAQGMCSDIMPHISGSDNWDGACPFSVPIPTHQTRSKKRGGAAGPSSKVANVVGSRQSSRTWNK